MKVKKTGSLVEGSVGAVRTRLPGSPEMQIDDQGKLTAQVSVWVPDGNGNSEQHHVVLTDGDIERLLTCLANPKDPEVAMAVSKIMRENLRNILRLSALGSGVSLID